jgi:hypothetical protein
MGASFTKLRLFFHKFCLIINTFATFAREALCLSRKALADWSGLFTHAVAARRRPPNGGVHEAHPSRGKKDESRRALNRDCREDEGEKIEGADWCG